MNFLPEDYKAPNTSENYMKLQKGENKIRILSKPIIGWEEWKDNKPLRFRINDKPAIPNDPAKPIKHFWSFIVWNHAEEKIQILNITSAMVRNAIQTLTKDADWGNVYSYDIKITKKGEGMKTEYIINPLPHRPIGEYVKEMFNEKPCNLDALFNNGDPFASGQAKYTPGMFDGQEGPKEEELRSIQNISAIQVEELQSILDKCAPIYVDELKGSLKKLIKSDQWKDIPLNLYDRIKNAALKKREENSINSEELPF